jgi:hypothetical protein
MSIPTSDGDTEEEGEVAVQEEDVDGGRVSVWAKQA